MSSTLLPFLYQTRTILRANPQTIVAFGRSFHVTRPQLKVSNDIPFVSGVEGDGIPFQRVRRSTITPSERQIFERIFADIRARGLKPALREDGPPPPPAASRSAMLIMQQAAYDAGQSRPASIASPALLAGAARDRNKALLRFPPDLRAAASKALDNIQGSASATSEPDDVAYDEASIGEDSVDEGWQAPAHTFGRTVELEAKRHPERTRVERLITVADTDLHLWKVLEQEVFTMPAKLGIDRTPSKLEEEAKSAKKKASKRKRMKFLDPIEEVAYDEEQAPSDDKLSLYVYGPLYPAYLLLALRRLDSGFRVSSPLAFSVLPRIKELGLESYVLGVSTPFYNELLEIYWTRRGDLYGMLDLLEEMRHCGLYFDEQTASILNQVDKETSDLATGIERSSFGRALMTMPEYDHPMRKRIRHWHRAVDLSIKERQRDIGY
ncbi:hypothetical protein AAE478_010654 [Parahypoxylon ruwenzoriense]